MACCDNWGVEVVPNPDESLVFPVHQLFIVKHGIYNLENIITEELAADKVYEFAFSFAPLRLKGATVKRHFHLEMVLRNGITKWYYKITYDFS